MPRSGRVSTGREFSGREMREDHEEIPGPLEPPEKPRNGAAMRLGVLRGQGGLGVPAPD